MPSKLFSVSFALVWSSVFTCKHNHVCVCVSRIEANFQFSSNPVDFSSFFSFLFRWYVSSYFKSYAWFVFYWREPYKINRKQPQGQSERVNKYFIKRNEPPSSPTNSKIKSNKSIFLLFAYSNSFVFRTLLSGPSDAANDVGPNSRIAVAVFVLSLCSLSLSLRSTTNFLAVSGVFFSAIEVIHSDSAKLYVKNKKPAWMTAKRVTRVDW